MGILHPRSEYLKKENTVEIEDLDKAIRRTEFYRTEKIENLTRQHEIIVREIKELKKQKVSYLRQLGLISTEDDIRTVIPSNTSDIIDSTQPDMASTKELNREDMLRNPTNPIYAYIRETFRTFLPEIERKIRDYDYRMVKLSLKEQRIKETIVMINQRESAPVESSKGKSYAF